ncbi:hypothetical protein ACM42_11380 [Bradyrhizobium sp. CCBAU 25338]|nr:hypothetical protein [Bradyrhizobium sp. CCBAU 25338]
MALARFGSWNDNTVGSAYRWVEPPHIRRYIGITRGQANQQVAGLLVEPLRKRVRWNEDADDAAFSRDLMAGGLGAQKFHIV